MAVRIQMRRGAATSWNATDPILAQGEFGLDTTSGQLKIGNGSTSWSGLDYLVTDSGLSSSLGDYIEIVDKGAANGVAELNSSSNVLTTTAVVFEGSSADDHETTLQVTNPTADRTITIPDSTGTILLADGSGNVTVSGNLTVQGTTTTIDSSTINITNSFVFEGTANDHETTLTITDPTADRTITLPDATGTVALTTDLSSFATTSYVTNSVSSHNATTTSVHGISDTAALATTSYVGTAIASFATTSYVTNSVSSHNATTTNIHGITDTAALATTSYVGTAIANFATTSFVGNSVSSHAATTATHGVSGAIVGTTDAQTLSSKTIALGSNTVSGSISEFNTALTDADFATLSGTETFANKTLTSPVVNTQITTASTSFNLLNTVATTINFGGAADIISIGSATSTVTVNKHLVVSGDLTVNGTTTTINSTTLSVDDKNIELASVASPTDITADGAGITVKGSTDKTFNWVDATDAWTASEHMNLVSGKSYKINNTAISAALPGLTWGEVKNGKSGLTIS